MVEQFHKTRKKLPISSEVLKKFMLKLIHMSLGAKVPVKAAIIRQWFATVQWPVEVEIVKIIHSARANNMLRC